VLGDDIPVKYLSWKHMARLWRKAPAEAARDAER